jgi:hypothetical protein
MLQNRSKDARGRLVLTPDKPARVFTFAVPAIAAVLAVLGLLIFHSSVSGAPVPGPKPAGGSPSPTQAMDNLSTADVAGAVLAASGLLFGTLLGAFGLLATWRERITSRDLSSEDQLGWMIDEGVFHTLAAVIESVIVALAALAGLLLPDFAARIALCVAIATVAHILYLFVLTTPRLYSAYTQINAVPAELDGHTHL